MLDSDTPFLAKAAVLERYAHAENPAADPVAVNLILRVLESKPDLRAHFFHSRPSAGWAPILWEKGLLRSPPLPADSDQGSVLPHWDAQYYLESVASEVPDIVLKHVKVISGHWWHISHAIRMLQSVPISHVAEAVPRIRAWLKDPETATGIAEEVAGLTGRLAQESKPESALQLFRALTAPRLMPDRVGKQKSWQTTAETADEHALGTKMEPSVGFEILKRSETSAVIEILEDHLIQSFKLEAERAGKPELENLFWWRNAIEDTDQDIINTYNDRIIVALRDTLEIGARSDPTAIVPLLARYLGAPQAILRRLGLHILHTFPNHFPDLVTEQLTEEQNLGDVAIRHEYFLLLQHGSTILSDSDKETLLAQILEGPSEDILTKVAARAHREHRVDAKEYVTHYKMVWIRDRLWMMRDQLDAKNQDKLDNLVSELGTPLHPEYLSWSSGFYSVRETSPYQDQELSAMPPDALVRLLENWRQDPADAFSRAEVTYDALANAVAGVVVDDLDKYEAYIPKIASARPEYARAIIATWDNPKEVASVPWYTAVSVCESLLETNISTSEERGRTDAPAWREVRLSVARLLENGFSNPDRLLPPDLLSRARDILLKLVDDPDPDMRADRPPSHFAGHNDPITVALNHVRPVALRALIHYALMQSSSSNKASGTKRRPAEEMHLEPKVKQVLTRKLDKRSEPSRAVHSIFGQYLPALYSIDKQWVSDNLGRIFPPETDDESIWFYVAAWDAYVFNRYRSDLMNLLRPQYTRAIKNVGRGYFIRSHLDSARQLAIHISFEYLSSSYALDSPQGQKSLIVEFFTRTPPEVRQHAAWALWRICDENPTKQSSFWRRARAVWQWRTQEFSIANHSPDFDGEMNYFAQLLRLAPETENMSTLRPLLEGLLPLFGRYGERRFGWTAVEKYLSTQVVEDPVKVIRFYRLMYDTRPARTRWIHHSDEARTIIEIAAYDTRSREDTLALIDLFAKWGNYTFQSIYERYSH